MSVDANVNNLYPIPVGGGVWSEAMARQRWKRNGIGERAGFRSLCSRYPGGGWCLERSDGASAPCREEGAMRRPGGTGQNGVEAAVSLGGPVRSTEGEETVPPSERKKGSRR